MRIARHQLVLGLVVLLVFSARLWLAFQVPFLEYDGYAVARQAQSILDSGLPLYQDTLSFGGRDAVLSPLYYYVVAGAGTIMPVEIAVKIVPNLLMSLLVILVYLLALQLTRHRWISVVVAACVSFIPSMMRYTVNNGSVYSLALLLLVGACWSILALPSKRGIIGLMVTIPLLALTHPLVIAFMLALLVWLVLLYVEKIRIEQYIFESSLFVLFAISWVIFMLYKPALVTYGIGVVWQNAPALLIADKFSQLGVLDALYAVGVVPLIFGAYAVYSAFFHQKNRVALLLISLLLVTVALVSMSLFELSAGLMLIGLCLVLLSAHALRLCFSYVEKTRFSTWRPVLVVIIIALFVLTSVVQGLSQSVVALQDTPSGSTVAALKWMKDNTNPRQTVLASLDEGHMVMYYAHRKTVADTNFLLVQNADRRFEHIRAVWSIPLETEAVSVMNEYSVDLIVFSTERLDRGLLIQPYFTDTTCFTKLYEDGAIIYTLHCEVQ